MLYCPGALTSVVPAYSTPITDQDHGRVPFTPECMCPALALSQTSYTQHAHGVRAFYFCRAGVGLLLVLPESLHGRCFPALCLQRLGNVVEALSIDAEI